tara:strand:- start:2118 stop:2339 length:222 start_codon:yes stop_codon:yes gene_type:complete
MPKVETKSISQVRKDNYSQAVGEGITAITLNGEFVGVLITCGNSSQELASLRHKRLLDNPVHTITELTKQVLQ